MSQVIISHAKQICHGNIKYDTAMLLSYSSLTTVFSTVYTSITPPRQNLDPQGGKSKSGLKLDQQTECEAVDLKTTTMLVLCKGYFHAGLKLCPQTNAHQG